MNIDEQILQSLRAWIYAATGLNKKNIIPFDDDAARPHLPYLAVELPAGDESVGIDSLIRGLDSAGSPTVKVRGSRRGTATVHGYGTDSGDLLRQLGLSLRKPAILELLVEENLSINNDGELLDVTANAGARREKRFVKDFAIRYLLEDSEADTQVELLNVGLDLTLSSSDTDPDAIIETITIDL